MMGYEPEDNAITAHRVIDEEEIIGIGGVIVMILVIILNAGSIGS
jgi:hypothetical protein